MENPILDDMPFNPHLTPEEMQDWENLTAEKKQILGKINTGIVTLGGLVIATIWSTAQSLTSQLYNPVTLIVYGAILCITYGGCALYAKTAPKRAMTIAISVLVGLYILFGLIHPANLVIGVLVKLVAFGLLLRARMAADSLEMVDFNLDLLAQKKAAG